MRSYTTEVDFQGVLREPQCTPCPMAVGGDPVVETFFYEKRLPEVVIGNLTAGKMESVLDLLAIQVF